MESIDRKPCVVLDTNIWRETLLLRGGLGPALLHVIHRHQGRIGLPEVVEGEIEKQILKAGLEAADEIRRRFRELRLILGAHRPYEAPFEDGITKAIGTRLKELAPLFVRVPMTLAHAQSALGRVNDETPPNSLKNQQFKDSLIWEAVLDLGSRYDIHFVTKDGGFYRDKEKTRLAVNLEQDCVARKVSLHIYSDLKPLLDALRADMPDIDRHQIAEAAYAAVQAEVATDAARYAMRLGRLVESEISPFITENHDMLAVQFRLVLEAIDLEEDGQRNELELCAEGQCGFSISTGQSTDAALDRIEYAWTDAAGERRSSKSAYLRGVSINLGRAPDVRYTHKEELP